MASNHTTNYQLCQWEATDKVLRTDFNEDNQKIDAAMKANADALAGKADSSALAEIAASIPKVAVGTYSGDGAASRTISLPFTPKAVFLCDQAGHTAEDISYLRNKYFYGGLALTGAPVVAGSFTLLTITENGFTVGQLTDSDNYQFYNGNASGVVYHYLAIG